MLSRHINKHPASDNASDDFPVFHATIMRVPDSTGNVI